MKSTSIYPLKIRFVYAVKHEKVEKMFTSRVEIEKVPTGNVHIFEYVKDDESRMWSTLPYSYCRKTHTEVAGNDLAWDEKDKRPEGLPMCKTCEQKYKEDPRSPWYAFSNGIGVKVDA